MARSKTPDESQLTMGSDLPSLVAKPFHFLIQEQAKCMVAIKDLQDQIQSLCHFRKAVTKAFPEVAVGVPRNMQYTTQWPKSYTSSSAGRMLPTVTPNNPRKPHRTEPIDKSKSRASSQKFVVVAQGKNWLRIRPHTNADSELDDSDDPMSACDSLCSSRRKNGANTRQDSGFSTEPQADKSLITPNDELSSLLDLIEAQSIELKHELTQIRTQNEPICESPTNDKTIQFLKREKDELAERLLVSEERSLNAHVRASQLEERLRTATTEREQLDMRIHGMHVQFVRPYSGRESLESNGGTDSGAKSPDDILKGKIHVKPNPGRLAAVLRETRLLELQKQLLTSVMENEVLKTQLEHVNKEWSKRTREWQRELDAAHNEARAAKIALERVKLDLQSEKARLRMLQRVVQTVPSLDGTANLNGHLLHSLHALGQSFTDHLKDKATNTDKMFSKRENIKYSNWKSDDDVLPSSSPASMTSPDTTNDVTSKNKWPSSPNLIDLNEESQHLVNGVKNGAKTTDPAIQQRIQNFLQRISEHLKPMEIMDDDNDYLETIL